MQLNIIHHKPCGSLEKIPDESIHAIVTSPPYNLSYRKQVSKKHNISGYGEFNDRIDEDEYQVQQIDILNACGRVLKKEGSVFYVHKDRRVKKITINPLMWINQVTALSLYQVIVWNRGSSHNVDGIRLPPTIEYVYWLTRPRELPRFNKETRKWGLVWKISPHSETGRINHPAPFPVAIPLRCLIMAAPSTDDIILDLYMGSGTTAVAAAILGVSWVGYEINAAYIELAQQRIAEAERFGKSLVGK